MPSTPLRRPLYGGVSSPYIAGVLVTSENPTGTITLSDLELTTTQDVRERTIWTASENRAAVSWATKGSATSLAARSHLLRLNALHQRAYGYVTRHHYIPGPANVMADDANRRWDLTDDDLLTHFNTRFPQTSSWKMRTLPSATAASLTGALSNKRASSTTRHRCLLLATVGDLLFQFGSRTLQTTKHRLHPFSPIVCPIIRPHRIHRARTSPGPISHDERGHISGASGTRQPGAPGPRLNSLGKVEYRLASLLTARKKADAPPRRVKPLPLHTGFLGC
jgi:hypothetical protein